MYGDTEDVTQNLAYVNTYPKSAPFRMCAKVYRSRVEFQTVHGRDLNQDKQKLHVDYDKEHLVCLNKEQLTKPILDEEGFKLSDVETPSDGDCFLHGILDQMR